MINFYLKFLTLLRPIFTRLGVNFEQLRAIVEVKLKMDNRRTRYNQAAKKQNESNSSFFWTLLIYAFLSIFMAVFIFFLDSVVAMYSIAFAYTMFMLAMTLITDFSAVILDSNDNAVLLPRPIDDRTLLIARITHILMYLLSMQFALSFASMVATGIKFGAGAVFIFLIINILSLILIVFLTNIFYLILMKFTSEEKLRNVINSFQIVLTFFFMGGYRVVGQMVSMEAIANNLAFQTRWWHFLLPPIWMGNTMDAIINHRFGTNQIIFILLTITMPFVLVYLVNNVFSGVFNDKIAGMDVAKKEEKTPQTVRKEGFVEKLSKIFTNTPAEKGAFEFVWKITSRDRKFKLRVYPLLGYMLIYPLFFFGSSKGGLAQRIEQMRQSESLSLMVIYFCFTIFLSIRTQIGFSEDFKAAWIFNLAPIQSPGEILSGAYRSVMVKYMLPVFLFLAVLISFLWGPSLLDDLAFGGLSILNLNLLNSIGGTNKLPFAHEITNKAGGTFLRNLLFISISIVIGIFHYFLMKVPYVILGFSILQLFLAWFLLKEFRKVGWEKIFVEK
jgi:ABC-2 type transport system permease protein